MEFGAAQRKCRATQQPAGERPHAILRANTSSLPPRTRQAAYLTILLPTSFATDLSSIVLRKPLLPLPNFQPLFVASVKSPNNQTHLTAPKLRQPSESEANLCEPSDHPASNLRLPFLLGLTLKLYHTDIYLHDIYDLRSTLLPRYLPQVYGIPAQQVPAKETRELCLLSYECLSTTSRLNA